jgi:phosphate:Na+ symporter
VLLFSPFTSKLVTLLEQKFRDEEEDAGRPYYLDKNVVTTPSLALNAMSLEITRIGSLARNMARASLSMEQVAGQRMLIEKQALNNLVDAVGKFTIRMQSADMPEEISAALPNALRVERYYSRVSELAIEIADSSHELARIEDETLVNAVGHFRAESARLLEISDPAQPEFSLQQCEELLQSLQVNYQELKSLLLRQGVEERIMVRQMVAHLDQYSNIRLMLQQAVKGAQYLSQLLALAIQYRQDQRNP